MTVAMRVRVAISLAVVLGLSLVAAAQTTAPSTAPTATQPASVAWSKPESLQKGKTYPVAVILAGDDEIKELEQNLREPLLRRKFFIMWVSWKTGGKVFHPQPADAAEKILALTKSSTAGNAVDPSHILLVATKTTARTGIDILERYPDRLAGAVLISAVPIRRSAGGFSLWSPSAGAWSVPLWIVAGTHPKDAAHTLLMWRQVAAGAPKKACLTIDTRIGESGGVLAPDAAIDRWFDAVAAGRQPARGPDRQAENEREFYKPFVDALAEAFEKTPAASSGARLSKSDGPLALAVTAPANWMRDQRGERAYDEQTSPYVQLYLTPGLAGPFFARACAAIRPGGAERLLDAHNRRLRKRGFLVISCRRWRRNRMAFECSTILWPTRQKWHRWLVLSGAGPARADGLVPLVLVMDASATPDPAAMAAAMKRLMASIQVQANR
ncbi:MAG: hypothetical protein SVT52_06950 [Planctomycetota bacterium]|nr:hypothetical protein [Planctomycetota bacterium]